MEQQIDHQQLTDRQGTKPRGVEIPVWDRHNDENRQSMLVVGNPENRDSWKDAFQLLRAGHDRPNGSFQDEDDLKADRYTNDEVENLRSLYEAAQYQASVYDNDLFGVTPEDRMTALMKLISEVGFPQHVISELHKRLATAAMRPVTIRHRGEDRDITSPPRADGTRPLALPQYGQLPGQPFNMSEINNPLSPVESNVKFLTPEQHESVTAYNEKGITPVMERIRELTVLRDRRAAELSQKYVDMGMSAEDISGKVDGDPELIEMNREIEIPYKKYLEEAAFLEKNDRMLENDEHFFKYGEGMPDEDDQPAKLPTNPPFIMDE